MTTVAIVLSNVITGGTLRHAREMSDSWSQQGNLVLLVVIVNNLIQISFFQNGKFLDKTFLYRDEDYSSLSKILKLYNTQILHVEHMLNADSALLSIHLALHIPLVVTLHDYYTICPFVNLIDKNGIYCQEKGEIECNVCLKDRVVYSSTLKKEVSDINEWRSVWKNYLDTASLVIVPSYDMRKRMMNYYSNINFCVKENPEIVNFENEIRQIGLLGGLSVPKGARKVKQCLSYCVRNKVSIHFTLFGTLEEINLTPEETQYITVLGPYKEHAIYQLIRQHNIDFFWFPGALPETYSYTLSIPIRLRIPCVSTDLGAIAERIRKHCWGEVYPWTFEASQIIKVLQTFPFQKFYNHDFAIKNNSFGSFKNYYEKLLNTYKLEESLNRYNQESIKIISRNVYSRLNEKLTISEFKLLWSDASITKKLILVKHLDLLWILKLVKYRGIKFVIQKIRSYL